MQIAENPNLTKPKRSLGSMCRPVAPVEAKPISKWDPGTLRHLVAPPPIRVVRWPPRMGPWAALPRLPKRPHAAPSMSHWSADQLHVQPIASPCPSSRSKAGQLPGPFADNGSPKPSEIRRWTRFVARDRGNQFPDDSEAAMEFAFRHSLSIADAFHRRLMRADARPNSPGYSMRPRAFQNNRGVALPYRPMSCVIINGEGKSKAAWNSFGNDFPSAKHAHIW
jgi:hypothetical protein